MREELGAVRVGDARGRRSRSGAEPHDGSRRRAAGVGLLEAVSSALVPGAPGRQREASGGGPPGPRDCQSPLASALSTGRVGGAGWPTAKDAGH